MEKTFKDELALAIKKLDRDLHLEAEKDRVHRDTMRDPHHAFRNVDIKGPDPWNVWTGLSL